MTSQSGFDWGDAGIGASVAFGALLLLLTVVALGRRYGPRINSVRFRHFIAATSTKSERAPSGPLSVWP